MPAPPVAPIEIPKACATGTGADAAFWDCLPRSSEWDEERARFLRDRVARNIGIDLDTLECRARCCRTRVSLDQYRAHSDELGSGVGLRVGPTDGYLANYVVGDPERLEIRTCWLPEPSDGYPDRGIERDELVESGAAEFSACAVGAGGPTERVALLRLAPTGEIEAIDWRGEPGDPATACLDAAIRSRATFAPSPGVMDRTVPIRIKIVPPS